MKKICSILILSILIAFYSCNNNDDNVPEYINIPTSPVTVDLTQIPYPKLSDYHFFEGD